MQLDVEVSPPAFVRAQLELECTHSVPRVSHLGPKGLMRKIAENCRWTHFNAKLHTCSHVPV